MFGESVRYFLIYLNQSVYCSQYSRAPEFNPETDSNNTALIGFWSITCCSYFRGVLRAEFHCIVLWHTVKPRLKNTL